MYKVYTTALAKRLREEVEGKGLIPMRFRKGMGMIGNIYTLNYLINKQIGKRKGKADSVDLRIAFDSMDKC